MHENHIRSQCQCPWIKFMSHAFADALPRAAFTIQWRSWVVTTETIWPTKPKVSTIWHLKKIFLTSAPEYQVIFGELVKQCSGRILKGHSEIFSCLISNTDIIKKKKKPLPIYVCFSPWVIDSYGRETHLQSRESGGNRSLAFQHVYKIQGNLSQYFHRFKSIFSSEFFSKKEEVERKTFTFRNGALTFHMICPGPQNVPHRNSTLWDAEPHLMRGWMVGEQIKYAIRVVLI